jgi:CDP-diacylglycerol--glycerol-3-phosphate 3-phosphatidyltransferase
MFDGRFRAPIEKGLRPLGLLLRKTGMSPDHFTLIGLGVSVGAAFAIGTGHLKWGMVLVILSALPDLLDGALAKASNQASQRGAFFDSVIDRVTDSIWLGGVAWYLASEESAHTAILPFAVMAVSSLISYERAKAESLGLYAKGGLMERAERIVILCVGLFFSSLLIPVLWLMLVLTSITAIQRFFQVWAQAEVSTTTQEKRNERRVRRMTRHSARETRRSLSPRTRRRSSQRTR